MVGRLVPDLVARRNGAAVTTPATLIVNKQGPAGPTGPAGPAGPTTFVATAAQTLAADQTSVSNTYIDLLAASIAVGTGQKLLITASCGVSINTNPDHINVRLYLTNGATTVVGPAVELDPVGINAPICACLAWGALGLAAGTWTVHLQWRTSGGSMQCRPVTVPDGEHAAFIAQVVSV